MVIPRQRELGLCVLLVNVLPLGSFRRWPRCLLVSGFLPRRQRTQGLLNFIEIRVRNNLRDYLHPLKKTMYHTFCARERWSESFVFIGYPIFPARYSRSDPGRKQKNSIGHI